MTAKPVSSRAWANLETALPETPKLVRRRTRFERAAPEHLRPGRLDRPRGGHRLLLGFDRAGSSDDGQIIAPDLEVEELDPRLGGMEIPIAELELARNPDDPLDPRIHLEHFVERLRQAPDHADDRSLLALGKVRGKPDLLDAFDDGTDLLLRRADLHNNDHRATSAGSAARIAATSSSE
jgi:hypothetical protein